MAKCSSKRRPKPMSPKAGVGKGTKYGCGGKIKKKQSSQAITVSIEIHTNGNSFMLYA